MQREDEDSEEDVEQDAESRPSKADDSGGAVSFEDGESSGDSDLENDDDDDDDDEVPGNSKRAPRLVEVKDDVDGILASGKRRKIKVNAPFGHRVESLERREAQRAARKAEKALAEKRKRNDRAEGRSSRRSFDSEMRAVKTRSAFK